MTKTYETLGQPPALFPALKKGERRTVSILLACVEQVPELAATLLERQGPKFGQRTTVQAWTEPGGQNLRLDGRLKVTTGKGREWTALLEFKVRDNVLTEEQIRKYLEHAKDVGADALITISNDFAVLPTHHPTYRKPLPENVSLLHWSWSSVLTKCELLIEMNRIADHGHRWVVGHLIRFLKHPKAGVVKRFDKMPKSWKDIMGDVDANASIQISKPVLEVVDAWIQECRDLSLKLSLSLGLPVPIKLTKHEQKYPQKLVEKVLDTLCRDKRLEVEYEILDSALLKRVQVVRVEVNLHERKLNSSVTVYAPQGPKMTTTRRVNWLLSQLPKSLKQKVVVKAVYGGREYVEEELKVLRSHPEALDKEDKNRRPNSFEIKLVNDISKENMNDPEKFIKQLESHVPEFYSKIGQHLRNWVPRAPAMEPPHDESVDAPQTESEEMVQK